MQSTELSYCFTQGENCVCLMMSNTTAIWETMVYFSLCSLAGIWTDDPLYTPETVTTLLVSYTPIQNNFFFKESRPHIISIKKEGGCYTEDLWTECISFSFLQICGLSSVKGHLHF